MSTGKYNLKLLKKFEQIEDNLRNGLAKAWGLEDPDDLPDEVQDIDIDSIREQADRAKYIMDTASKAEGFGSADKTIIQETISQTLEAMDKLGEEDATFA